MASAIDTKLLGGRVKNLIGMVATWFAALAVLAHAATSEAAEIKVLSAIGMQSVLEDLGPRFERATGHKLAVSFATAGAAVKRAQDGEAADVVIATRQGIDGLVKNGKAAADNVTALASAGISVAIRKGAPKPDISSQDALKRTLLAAKSISYVNPASGGASGIHFVELVPVAGIDILGPLPGDLQNTIAFAAAVMGTSKDAEAAKALVNFLRTPEAAAVMKAKGMEPS
jgi:molybdate transport system substrate-binding protein